jgi:hypothetical protein
MDDITLWVFLPIFFSMLLVALLQENLRKLFLTSQSGKVSESRFVLDQTLARAARLRTNGSALPESSFRRHRAAFTNKENGSLSKVRFCFDAGLFLVRSRKLAQGGERKRKGFGADKDDLVVDRVLGCWRSRKRHVEAILAQFRPHCVARRVCESFFQRLCCWPFAIPAACFVQVVVAWRNFPSRGDVFQWSRVCPPFFCSLYFHSLTRVIFRLFLGMCCR